MPYDLKCMCLSNTFDVLSSTLCTPQAFFVEEGCYTSLYRCRFQMLRVISSLNCIDLLTVALWDAKKGGIV